MPTNERLRAILRLIVPVVAVCVALPLLYLFVWRGVRPPLVVYCTHDSVFSEPIVKQFEQRTGIRVAMRFDSEATKSLGLVEQIISEKENPRCDVFWNNELLGTMDLQKRGLLTPYKSLNAARIPASFKDPDGYWTGFAGRMRVLMYTAQAVAHNEALSANNLASGYVPESVPALPREKLTRIAMAKPLYGTTFTHYCVLWKIWGGEKLKAWHKDRERMGVHEVLGNAQVREAVTAGACEWGFADSDDFYAAKDEGAQVNMLATCAGSGQTICIPNTVCIIEGTRRLADAQKLVDFLLSEECELALANSKSRQIPLGSVDESKLTPEVKELKLWAAKAYPIVELGAVRDDCLAWLKSEYIK